MFRYSLSGYLFALTLLELIIKTHLTSHDSSHGFINKNGKYLEDDFKSIHEEISSGLRASQINDFNLNLKLEPSILDFKQRQLGIAHLEKVTLFNTDKNKTIDMTSISGSTAYFHSSFFETKKIPPNGNTTFNVVFLGREEGLVEGNLFIHSSDGYFKYSVKGATTYSRFRLRPIVGVKLPLNATFSPLIYLYNPHPKPVQITEVYSSGGEFHLELPTGDQEGPNDLWEIAPYQTKAIIRVRFRGKVVQNHTAYVRIKLNSQSELLVVPLEVEVTPDAEMVHPQGGIDFGIGGNLDPPKEAKLCVSNPTKKPMRVHSVTATSKAIEVSYEPARVMPDADDNSGCTEVATLTLNWKHAFDKQEFSGKIHIKYRQGKNTTVIPYYLTVLDGGVTFDLLQTSYFVDEHAGDLNSRDFVVRNDFYSPVEVLGYEMQDEAKKYFRIESFTPMVLKPTNEKTIFRIKLKPNANLSGVNLNSQITIKTNVTEIAVPLLSYKGKLKLFLPYKGPDNTLDIGLISYNTQKNVYFLLANPNPVSLVMKTIRSSIPMTNMELMGCKKGNYESALLQIKHRNLTNCINIKPNHYAVVKLSIQTSGSEGQIWGDVYVETQYEQLSIPVHFRVAPGKLEVGPDRLVFDQCFPGKICSHPLRVHSTFREPMIIENIVSLPPDKRISSKHSGHILAGTSKVIGHLYLDPNAECKTQCYTGLGEVDYWIKSLTFSNFTRDFDIVMLNILYSRYLNETADGLRKWQNMTIRIDTSEVKGHIFKTRVKMSWPSLLLSDSVENRSVFVFPTTQIGNLSYRNISLRNPSAHNLIIQLVFDKNYGDVDLLYNVFPKELLPKKTKEYQQYGFFFVDYKRHLDKFREKLKWDYADETLPFLLAPGENVTVTVGFRAEETNYVSSLLVIRNNLTIVELITMRGQGVHPQFKFGNRKPGSEQPLSFDMTERHLKDCEKDKSSGFTPNLTVKRSFTARNIGDVTIYVNSFYINDYPCEGYGFKVINCVPFVLHPNATRKIDIAFTPDLTLSKVTRTLILGTSLNFPVNYTLYTTIPSQYLSMCSELIMRPYWEIYVSYAANGLMVALLFVIVFLAALDADKIKRQSMREALSSPTASVQPVLDLRLVGQQTREEIKAKPDKSDNNNDNDLGKHKFKENVENGVNKSKAKDESDRYSAMVAVSGTRGKKKLGKRNSGELAQEPPEVPKKPPEVQQPKAKPVEKRTNVVAPTQTQPKISNGKPASGKKVQARNNGTINNGTNTSVPAYEEESSSTTTESSSNLEDPDKENEQQQQQQKVYAKKSPYQKMEEINNKANEAANVHQEVCKQENNMHNKVERQRSNPKSRTKPFKESQESSTMKPPSNDANQTSNASPTNNTTSPATANAFGNAKREHKKPGGKTHKDRKERRSDYKKLAAEKAAAAAAALALKVNAEARKSPVSPPPRASSPKSPSTVWSENSATFSDVVARTETLSTNRPLCQKAALNAKPTVYVEPYKQTPSADLGPVGSRRVEHYGDAYLGHGSQPTQPPHAPHQPPPAQQTHVVDTSNSFFSTAPPPPQQQEQLLRQPEPAGPMPPQDVVAGGYLEDFLQAEPWAQTQVYGNGLDRDIYDGNGQNQNKDWNHHHASTDNTSFWNHHFGLFGPGPATTISAPVSTLAAAAQQQQQQMHQQQQQINYLWGSSSVWQPWTPAVEPPRTPTRTPPGFSELQPRNVVNECQLQQHQQHQAHAPRADSYSPFPVSNIWNSEPNPWSYNQGQ